MNNTPRLHASPLPPSFSPDRWSPRSFDQGSHSPLFGEPASFDTSSPPSLLLFRREDTPHPFLPNHSGIFGAVGEGRPSGSDADDEDSVRSSSPSLCDLLHAPGEEHLGLGAVNIGGWSDMRSSIGRGRTPTYYRVRDDEEARRSE
jgi:hypothetical protein